MSARDLARFGLLYLNKGAWAGKQLVPARLGPRKHAPLFGATQLRARLRLSVVDRSAYAGAGLDSGGTFIAWGAGGQHAFVIPAYDLVVVNRVDRDQNLPEPKLSEVKQFAQPDVEGRSFQSPVTALHA